MLFFPGLEKSWKLTPGFGKFLKSHENCKASFHEMALLLSFIQSFNRRIRLCNAGMMFANFGIIACWLIADQ